MNLLLIIVIVVIVVLLVWLIASNSNTVKVDWNRYLGTWYEIARLPMPFENNCINATAQYSRNVDGTINVINRCEVNGQNVQANGIANIVSNNKLSVKFENNPTNGSYTVLYLDPNYQTAIVGSTNKDYLWILARKPTIDALTYQELLDRAKKLGFDVNKLIIN